MPIPSRSPTPEIRISHEIHNSQSRMPEVSGHRIKISIDKRGRSDSRMHSPIEGFRKQSTRSIYQKSINEDVLPVYSGLDYAKESPMAKEQNALELDFQQTKSRGRSALSNIKNSITQPVEPTEVQLTIKTATNDNPLHLKLDLKP
jgi:hypothetical protein